MMKWSLRLLLPWTAVFMVSSTLAYTLNVAVVGAATNSSQPAPRPVVALLAASDPSLSDAPRDNSKNCLAAWRYVSTERPGVYAAGFEHFADSGCTAP